MNVYQNVHQIADSSIYKITSVSSKVKVVWGPRPSVGLMFIYYVNKQNGNITSSPTNDTLGGASNHIYGLKTLLEDFVII